MNVKNINLTGLKVDYAETTSIPPLEQECHLNIDRNVSNDDTITICCSHQGYILELQKSEYFTLTGVLVSSHDKSKGFILQINGTLDPRGLTIRKKIPVITEEMRKQRSETAKRNFSKNV